MTIEEACRLLGVTSKDSPQAAKLKYRRLISLYHPDAVGADDPEYTARAQEINHAYHLIKNRIQELNSRESTSDIHFHGIQNPTAVCERNIYMRYHMDEHYFDDEDARMANEMYQTVGRGKYYWNPDEEDFDLFLKSIHHAMVDYIREKGMDNPDLTMQVKHFEYLCGQFIKPKECLKALKEPEYHDKEGREVYHIRAFLGAKPGTDEFRNIRELVQDDTIYPTGFMNNRIMVSDGKKRSLGYISLEDDALYLCIIPLLKSHAAHVKMTVEKVGQAKRGYPVRANIEFYLRIA